MNRRTLSDEDATLALGADLAQSLRDDLVFLRGDLGAGKTTLVRGILRQLGFSGSVKSPTYTLLEPYDLGTRRIYHFDFYRIEHPEELSYVGIDDLMAESALKLIEWPERAFERLPQPDVEVRFSMDRQGRSVEIIDHRSS